MPQLKDVTQPLATPGFAKGSTEATTARYDNSEEIKDITKGIGTVAKNLVDIRNQELLGELEGDVTSVQRIVSASEAGIDRDKSINDLSLARGTSKGSKVFSGLIRDFNKAKGTSTQLGNITNVQAVNVRAEALLRKFVTDNPDLGKEAIAIMKTIIGSDPTGAGLKYQDFKLRQQAAEEADKSKSEVSAYANLLKKANLPVNKAGIQVLKSSGMEKTLAVQAKSQATLDALSIASDVSVEHATSFVNETIIRDSAILQANMQRSQVDFQSKLDASETPQETKAIYQARNTELKTMRKGLLERKGMWQVAVEARDVAGLTAILGDERAAKRIIDSFKSSRTGDIISIAENNTALNSITAELDAAIELTSDEAVAKIAEQSVDATIATNLLTLTQNSHSAQSMLLKDRYLANSMSANAFADTLLQGQRVLDDITSFVYFKEVPKDYIIGYTNGQSTFADYNHNVPKNTIRSTNRQIEGYLQKGKSLQEATKLVHTTDFKVQEDSLKRLTRPYDAYTLGDTASREGDLINLGAYVGMYVNKLDAEGELLMTTQARMQLEQGISSMSKADIARIKHTAGPESTGILADNALVHFQMSTPKVVDLLQRSPRLKAGTYKYSMSTGKLNSKISTSGIMLDVMARKGDRVVTNEMQKALNYKVTQMKLEDLDLLSASEEIQQLFGIDNFIFVE